MSAIAGIIRFDGSQVAPGLLEDMTTVMAYRGSDAVSHWSNGSVALGHCMLRTTPESVEEEQPLANQDASLVLVMDGWLSNWVELRERLRCEGVVLRNRSDAELVLKAYQRWGQDCLRYLEGDFALLIWNSRRRELFCARDRMGHKPFYYHWSGQVLAVASDIPSLLALPWIARKPNEGMLAEILAVDWHSRDETPWVGITRLVAAHYMVVSGKEPRPLQYWSPDLWAAAPYTRDEDYIEHYRELYTDIVRRHTRSLRPVAIEVSGGLDSSSVVCLAEHLRREGRLPATGLKAYSLLFDEGTDADEIGYAREVGEYLGLSISEISASEIALSWYLEQASSSADFPGFSNMALAGNLLRAAKSDGAAVLLTGEGGDGWLQGGRAYYEEEFRERRWATLLGCLRVDIDAYGFKEMLRQGLRDGVFGRLPDRLQAIIRGCSLAPDQNPAQNAPWLSPRMREMLLARQAHSNAVCQKAVQYSGQRQLMECLRDAFTAHLMERLDRFGARNGLEMRHPMNDPRFVQFAFVTPERLRLRGRQTKWIHRRALEGLMPGRVLERTDKADFSFALLRDAAKIKLDLPRKIYPRRSNWIVPEAFEKVTESCETSAVPGLSMWILCSLYGCDSLLTESVVGTPKA